MKRRDVYDRLEIIAGVSVCGKQYKERFYNEYSDYYRVGMDNG